MRRPVLKCNPFVPGGQVLIEAAVLATIDAFRQDRAWKPESGGILLGFRRDDHLHVVEATTPYTGDEQQRFRFKRTSHPHQMHALKRWHDSGGKMDYLGEWHTHPEQHPCPSCIDLSQWRRIYEVRPSPMLFLIAGVGGHDWLGMGYQSKLKPLAL